jgi:hypothetical protein
MSAANGRIGIESVMKAEESQKSIAATASM